MGGGKKGFARIIFINSLILFFFICKTGGKISFARIVFPNYFFCVVVIVISDSRG